MKKLSDKQLSNQTIIVGARSSPLSQVQVTEVLEEIKIHFPDIRFEPVFISTQGDLDLKTSLRQIEKTNFFTKEIDDLLLEGKCEIAIHSAKDLPDPLPEGLVIAAITQGVDPSDVCVFRKGDSLDKLPSEAIIGTSSYRREEMMKQLRQDLCFQDIRGTIHQRLAKLESGEVDGLIVAEAALIRLNLTHLPRVQLPGETVPMQGKLAVVTHEDNRDMLDLFAWIDSRQRFFCK